MNTNWRLIRQARSSGLLFSFTILFGFLAGGLVVWQADQMSRAINDVFLNRFALTEIFPYLRIILMIVLGRVIFTALNETLAGRLAVRVKTLLRQQMLEKINRLGPAFVKGEKTGELTTVAIQGIDALDAYFSQYLPQILIAVMLPITILIVVFPLDPLTGLVFLLTAPLIPLFMMLVGWASESLTRKQWLALSRLGDFLLDTLQGIATLKMLGRSQQRAGEIGEVSDRYRISTMTVLRVTFLSALVLELVATISTAVVAVEIGLRLLHGRIFFQQAFFILLIAPEFYLPMRNLGARYHAGMAGITAAKRIYTLLDTPEPVNSILHLDHPQPSNPFEKPFVLSIKNLRFTYQGSASPILENINLDIQRGKHYALVGPNGAGKSTFTQILLRFLDAYTGEISINGIDMRAWSAATWRKSLAWVPQQPTLFNTSMLENIRLGDEMISEDQVMQALRSVSLDDLVSNWPQGLATGLGEKGARLSGGEAQRVALARAFLKDAPLIILDEPTSHLDVQLEAILKKSISRLTEGHTTLTIAHRFSTIRAADGIIVLDRGQLVDIGTHHQLIHRCRMYQQFINAERGEA